MRFKNPFHLQKFLLEALTRVPISKWPLTLLALHLSTQIATIQVGQYIPTHSTSHKVDRVSLQYLHRFPQEQSNLLSGKVTKSKQSKSNDYINVRLSKSQWSREASLGFTFRYVYTNMKSPCFDSVHSTMI